MEPVWKWVLGLWQLQYFLLPGACSLDALCQNYTASLILFHWPSMESSEDPRVLLDKLRTPQCHPYLASWCQFEHS